ncbi:zinc finger protein 197-like [Mya arenaria]|uniref:zinc finger protein 197-like n=1 Tax=Mya arenaria TaxID=6604 RepID=UPI0022DF2696|nr:zinc finger protein 197-like [Mya arenaria]XP_052774610.1 zinc finger protein 197-like [Mya arenaria]
MEAYVLLLLVKADQEAAIRDLFLQHGWPFSKTGSRPPFYEELLHVGFVEDRGHSYNRPNMSSTNEGVVYPNAVTNSVAMEAYKNQEQTVEIIASDHQVFASNVDYSKHGVSENNIKANQKGITDKQQMAFDPVKRPEVDSLSFQSKLVSVSKPADMNSSLSEQKVHGEGKENAPLRTDSSETSLSTRLCHKLFDLQKFAAALADKIYVLLKLNEGGQQGLQLSNKELFEVVMRACKKTGDLENIVSEENSIPYGNENTSFENNSFFTTESCKAVESDAESDKTIDFEDDAIHLNNDIVKSELHGDSRDVQDLLQHSGNHNKSKRMKQNNYGKGLSKNAHRLTKLKLKKNISLKHSKKVKQEVHNPNSAVMDYNEVKLEISCTASGNTHEQDTRKSIQSVRRRRGRPTRQEMRQRQGIRLLKPMSGTGLISKAKRYSVNRNFKLHTFHKRCPEVPFDMDSDNYSASLNGYYCSDCKFLFQKKNKLELHKRVKVRGVCVPDCIFCDAEENKEVFQCSKCPKVFETKELLDRHVDRHNIEQFPCTFCYQIFYTIPDLQYHKKVEHSDQVETHLCDLCGSKFKDKKVLVQHRKYVHSDERKEECPTCGRKFKTKSQLKNHLVVHVDAESLNLSCEICGKMFVRASTLRDHVRRHKKEFTFFCDVCNKGFYRKAGMEEHKRTHTGDKPFTCRVCGYKCALSCNLVKHIRTHQKKQMVAENQFVPGKALYMQTYIAS